MASVLRENGLEESAVPSADGAFSIEEVEGIVGGYIELHILKEKEIILCCRANAYIEGKKLNQKASEKAGIAVYGIALVSEFTSVEMVDIVIGVKPTLQEGSPQDRTHCNESLSFLERISFARDEGDVRLYWNAGVGHEVFCRHLNGTPVILDEVLAEMKETLSWIKQSFELMLGYFDTKGGEEGHNTAIFRMVGVFYTGEKNAVSPETIPTEGVVGDALHNYLHRNRN